MPHIPVLRKEVVEHLALRSGDDAIDCTFGGGGYTRAMLDVTAPNGRVLAFDCDPEAVARAAALPWVAAHRERCTIVHANFAGIATVAPAHGFPVVQAIVADLGLSSNQLAGSHRGFSFAADGPLDMRCDPTGSASTAAELLNAMPEAAIERVLIEYGEEPRARRIAEAIIAARRSDRIVSTAQLSAIVESIVPRRGRIHPATRVFQALRIAVNDELGNLTRAIPQMLGLLAPGGRLAIVSFHSLEDRIVKRAFRSAALRDGYELRTKRPIVPMASEVTANPRSRSAKLRIIERPA